MSEQQQQDQRMEEIAQEKFGKSFEECDPIERVAVGGTLGGETRKEQMAEGRGEEGVHEAYAEMGREGGEARQEQVQKEKEKETE